MKIWTAINMYVRKERKKQKEKNLTEVEMDLKIQKGASLLWSSFSLIRGGHSHSEKLLHLSSYYNLLSNYFIGGWSGIIQYLPFHILQMFLKRASLIGHLKSLIARKRGAQGHWVCYETVIALLHCSLLYSCYTITYTGKVCHLCLLISWPAELLSSWPSLYLQILDRDNMILDRDNMLPFKQASYPS